MVYARQYRIVSQNKCKNRHRFQSLISDFQAAWDVHLGVVTQWPYVSECFLFLFFLKLQLPYRLCQQYVSCTIQYSPEILTIAIQYFCRIYSIKSYKILIVFPVLYTTLLQLINFIPSSCISHSSSNFAHLLRLLPSGKTSSFYS